MIFLNTRGCASRSLLDSYYYVLSLLLLLSLSRSGSRQKLGKFAREEHVKILIFCKMQLKQIHDIVQKPQFIPREGVGWAEGRPVNTLEGSLISQL